MTRHIRTLAFVAVAGGLAWLAKFLVIAATDGAESGAADAATSVLYLLGVALMCLGAASLTLRLADGRGRLVAAAAVVAAPILAILVYMALDAVVKPAVGGAGPAWLPDEAPIAVTGALWIAAGLASLRRAPHPLGAARAA